MIYLSYVVIGVKRRYLSWIYCCVFIVIKNNFNDIHHEYR
jgi:hypothetical protein